MVITNQFNNIVIRFRTFSLVHSKIFKKIENSIFDIDYRLLVITYQFENNAIRLIAFDLVYKKNKKKFGHQRDSNLQPSG